MKFVCMHDIMYNIAIAWPVFMPIIDNHFKLPWQGVAIHIIMRTNYAGYHARQIGNQYGNLIFSWSFKQFSYILNMNG